MMIQKIKEVTKTSIIQKAGAFALILLFSVLNGYAHSGFVKHGEDIMAVLGFKYNTKLFNRSKDKSNQSWVKFISGDMIDNNTFHKQLDQDYEGLNISHSRNHRLLFHWAYEAEPWSTELEKFIRNYCEKYDLNIESNIRVFKAKIKSEQARRNRLIIQKTEQIFRLAQDDDKGGTKSVYSHFLASMAYNVHILGDYTSDDNTVLNGLYPFEKLVGQFVDELRKLDYAKSKDIVRGITRINHKNIDVQDKADELMLYLKLHVPAFIKEARNGSFKRLLENRGFNFR